jgi:PKD repeat protein/general stress protein CsbA
MRGTLRSFTDWRGKSRGQSMVEFALLFPVLLLILLVGIDFGRVYLGWVNLQNLTRIAANYAADHATAWVVPQDAVTLARYEKFVRNDAKLMNCDLPPTLPEPQFAAGTALGANVTVSFTCEFHLITPVISAVIGGTILAGAESTFPVKEGIVATVPGGGAPIELPPVADFIGSPQSGWSPLSVTFTDLSLNNPSSWTWNYINSFSGTGAGVGSVNPMTSLTKGPRTVIYTCTGAPGDTCTFGVSLGVQNGGGIDAETKNAYVTVTVPPAAPAPVADFTGTPRSGIQPLAVTFQFKDLRPGTVTYTNWQWDFTNDGTFDATGLTASHTYPAVGAYNVRLKVTDNTGATNTLVKTAYIVVGKRTCTVPDFANVNLNQAQGVWNGAGFTTTVNSVPGKQNYKIRSQTILGGTIDPQPDGCASTITVGP